MYTLFINGVINPVFSSGGFDLFYQHLSLGNLRLSPLYSIHQKMKDHTFLFTGLITHNNKSSFRSSRISSMKCQVLTLTVVITFHNKIKLNTTHIKMPVSQIFCTLHNKNMLDIKACILK